MSNLTLLKNKPSFNASLLHDPDEANYIPFNDIVDHFTNRDNVSNDFKSCTLLDGTYIELSKAKKGVHIVRPPNHPFGYDESKYIPFKKGSSITRSSNWF